MKISERSNPVGYQAALVRALLRAGLDHNADDATLDDVATATGLRPPTQVETRESVRTALESPLNLIEDSNQDAWHAIAFALEDRRVLVVVGADGHRTVMVPQPVSEPA
ncbi:hypothetical protein ACIBL8_21760 [Streptomyces sp. NPDC050523]|uniref:hypothetical protein n=1 Tax=Streptomyces sp. NPDC050523 TaxID=3365622 RepID=UPI0037A099FB